MNDLTTVIHGMSDRIRESRERFVLPQADRRTDAELPPLLQGYAPALKWHDSTIETWLAIRQVPRSNVRPIIIEPERWLRLFEDVLRTTGVTPWCSPHDRHDLAIQFAGHWCAPDLDLLMPGKIAVTPTPAPVLTVQHTEIRFDGAESGGVYLINLPRRLGRLRVISGLEALNIGIPRASIRGPVMSNQDCAYVDRRCLARYRRRAREAQRRAA